MGGAQVSTYNQIYNYPAASKEYLVMQQPLQAVAGTPQRIMGPAVSSSQGLWLGAQEPRQSVQQFATYQLSTPMASQPMMVMKNVPMQPQVLQVQRQVQPQVIRVQQQQPQYVQLQQQQPQMVQMPAQQKTTSEVVYLNVNGVMKQGIVQNGSVYLLEPPVHQAATNMPARPAMTGISRPGARAVIQLAPAQVQAPTQHQTFPQSSPMYVQQQPQQVQQPARFFNTAGPQMAAKPLAPTSTILQPVQVQQQQLAVQYTTAAQSGVTNHQPLVISHPSNHAQGPQLGMTHAQASKGPIQPLVISSASSAAQQAQASMGPSPDMGAAPVPNRLLSTAALVRGLTAGEGHAPVSGSTAAMAPAAASRLAQSVTGITSSLPHAAALAPQQLLQVQPGPQAEPAATSALVAAAASAAAAAAAGAAPAGGSPGSVDAYRVMFNPTAKGSVGVIGDARRSREDGTSGFASGNSTPKAPASATGSRPATPQPMLGVPAGPSADLAATTFTTDDNNMQQVWGVLTEEAKRCGLSLESLAILGGSPIKNQGVDVGIAAVKNESALEMMLDGPMNGASGGAGVLGFNAFGFSFFGGAADVASVMEGNATAASSSAGFPGAGLGLAEHKLGNLLQGLDLGSTA